MVNEQWVNSYCVEQKSFHTELLNEYIKHNTAHVLGVRDVPNYRMVGLYNSFEESQNDMERLNELLNAKAHTDK